MKAESFFELENLLNKLFCNSYTTTFASTHLAHLGVLPLLGSGEMPSFTLNSQGPLFIVDRTAHASIQINRGLLSQFGQVVITDFKSLSELEHYFKEANEHQKTPVALADGVGSMGDTVSVNELMEFAEKYHGYVYLDDAHGTSLFGKNGCGFVLDKLNHIFHPRLILVMSLSKGFGTNGGVVAVPTKSDEEIIKRFSTTYVFGNPPPLAIVDASIQSAHIHLSEEICSLQNSLRENIRYFDLHMAGFHKSNPIVNYGTELPIRGILVGEEFKAIACSKELMHKGYLVMAAIYPTVPKGKSMLRASLSSIHDKNDILNFCNSMKEVLSHQFN
jgi:7-keto-8-aminopelargonate synthetase-like enzyme